MGKIKIVASDKEAIQINRERPNASIKRGSVSKATYHFNENPSGNIVAPQLDDKE